MLYHEKLPREYISQLSKICIFSISIIKHESIVQDSNYVATLNTLIIGT